MIMSGIVIKSRIEPLMRNHCRALPSGITHPAARRIDPNIGEEIPPNIPTAEPNMSTLDGLIITTSIKIRQLS
jgi:hypothetical protein